MRADEVRGLTYGYPGMVEVWVRGSEDDPVPMSPGAAVEWCRELDAAYAGPRAGGEGVRVVGRE